MRQSTCMHERVYVYVLLCVSKNGHLHLCVRRCVLVYTCDSVSSGSCADALWVYVNVCVYV